MPITSILSTNVSYFIYTDESQALFMSSQEKGYFTILAQISESSFKIKENVPESVEELIEIAQSGPAKTEDGKSLIVLKTTQGRQFVRLEEWPKNLLLEILKS